MEFKGNIKIYESESSYNAIFKHVYENGFVFLFISKAKSHNFGNDFIFRQYTVDILCFK